MLKLPVLTAPTRTLADADGLAEQLRALAEPNRLQIIALLRDSERCVCEIEAALGLSQSLVSNHLRVLRRAGLVQARRDDVDARWIYYQLSQETVERLLARLSNLLDLSHFDPRPVDCTPDGQPVRAT
jgi:ArsR family transcriptional regulator